MSFEEIYYNLRETNEFKNTCGIKLLKEMIVLLKTQLIETTKNYMELYEKYNISQEELSEVHEAFEDVNTKYQKLEEEFNIYKNDVESNMKPISVKEQLGICDNDFI